MKRIITMLAFLFCVAMASAQSSVSGNVTDRQNRPVSYATVAQLRESNHVTAVASDLQGRFSLTAREQGKYKLSISAVGHTTYTAELTIASENIDLDTIRLEEGVDMEAVSLTIQKPIVTSDAEKLTYSVEDDPEAQSRQQFPDYWY